MEDKKGITTYTRDEAEEMDIESLLNHYSDACEQVAIEGLSIGFSYPAAKENIQILGDELRKRLHAGANAKRSFDDIRIATVRID